MAARRSPATVTRSSTTVRQPSVAFSLRLFQRHRPPVLQHPPQARLREQLAQRRRLGLAHPGAKADQRRPARPGCQQAIEDRRRARAGDRLVAAAAIQLGRPRVQRPQVIGDRGHGADGRARRAHRRGAIDGHRRQHPLQPVGLGPIQAFQELPGVGAEGLDVTPVALGIQDVEGQRRLARPGHPGDRRDHADGNADRHAPEVVLPGPFNLYEARVLHVGGAA